MHISQSAKEKRERMEWKEKLYGTYPVVQMASIAVPSPVGSAYAMKLLGVKNPASFLKEQAEINWQKLPYLKDVLPEEMFADSERNRMVILVSDNLRITEKVAAVATYRLVAQAQQDEMQEFGFDYDDYDEYEYDVDDEERQPGKSENQRMNMAYACTYVNFQKEQAEEDRSMNLLGRLSSMMSNSIFFTGIAENGKLDEQIDVIQASESVHKFVHVRKNQCKEAWVLGLRQKYDAIVLEIPDVPETYYCSVIQEMLPALACTLADDLTPEKLVQRVKQRAVLDEETLVWILSQAVSHAQKKAGGITDLPALTRDDFVELAPWGEDALTRLHKMTGLLDIKQTLTEYSALAEEISQNKDLRDMHLHLIFCGNPGTGKTTLAKWTADILAESGVGNAAFVVCTREDLIGKYVGHTAPKVAKKFEEARGGVLFVDEAGFFLNRGAGGFVDEAVKEFVRFMELYLDVTVIFAMYESEVADFLGKDEGLASRIAQVVHFADYTTEELWAIAKQMLGTQGYKLSNTCRECFDGYMEARRKREDFGNAREARKLVETCIRMIGLRHAGAKSQKEREDMTIREADMQAAMRRLAVERTGRKAQTMGFAFPKTVCKV